MIITEKDAWMTDSLDRQRREYVISRTRDGKVMENKPLGDVGYHVRRGGTAYRRGDERWANPYEGGRARAWTYGWERAHTTEKHGHTVSGIGSGSRRLWHNDRGALVDGAST